MEIHGDIALPTFPWQHNRHAVVFANVEVSHMKSIFSLFVFLVLSSTVLAVNMPYDEKADGASDVRSALLRARGSDKDVLLVFGANWCPDCRELDKALHGKSSQQIDAKFIVVKIDVGQFDKNIALEKSYGNPIKKGIPAAVILTADDKIIYSTKGGELADARKMGEQGIYDFFNRVIQHRQ
jgi:protein disulfide-isomerase